VRAWRRSGGRRRTITTRYVRIEILKDLFAVSRCSLRLLRSNFLYDLLTYNVYVCCILLYGWQAKKYFKDPTELIKEKEAAMRGSDNIEGNALIEKLKQQSVDNKEKNDLEVQRKTFENDEVRVVLDAMIASSTRIQYFLGRLLSLRSVSNTLRLCLY